MPLRSYHASLPTEGRIDYETLEQLAREGKLAGTYKQGRNWWINLLAHMQLGMGGRPMSTKKTTTKAPAPRREKGLGGVIKRGNRYYGRIRSKEDGTRLTAPCASRAEAEEALRRMFVGEIDPKNTPKLQDYLGALLREHGDEPLPGAPPLPDIYYTECRGRLAERLDPETWKVY